MSWILHQSAIERDRVFEAHRNLLEKEWQRKVMRPSTAQSHGSESRISGPEIDEMDKVSFKEIVEEVRGSQGRDTHLLASSLACEFESISAQRLILTAMAMTMSSGMVSKGERDFPETLAGVDRSWTMKGMSGQKRRCCDEKFEI